MIELLEFTCGRCDAVNRLKFEKVLALQGNPKCGVCREPLLKLLNEPLHGLDPSSYTHPLDKEALHALKRIPGIKTLLKWLISNSVEMSTRLNHHANFLKVGEHQVPSLYRRFRLAADRIGVSELPDLFIYNSAQPNAYTFGVEHYFIAISTGCLDLLTEEEQMGVLAHELGHVHSDHVLYKTAARLVKSVASEVAQATMGVGNLVMVPLQMALLRWDRASELTADRAELLAVRRPEVVLSTHMKMAGGAQSIMKELSVKAFIEQAEHFESMRDETLNSKVAVMFETIFRTHPYPVYRAKELLEWVSTGEFLEILDGEYTQRSMVQTRPCPRCSKPMTEGTIVCPHCAWGGEEDMKEPVPGNPEDSLGTRLDKGWDDARDWFKRQFGGDNDAKSAEKDKEKDKGKDA